MNSKTCPITDADDGAGRRLVIEVFFDFVCPWCLIGKRHLAEALRKLSQTHPELDWQVRWRSVQLLPEIPPEGAPYQAFYLRRLGNAAALAERRGQIKEAGRAAGVEFDFEGMAVMPNTGAAHRMISGAAGFGSQEQQSELVERVFRAYFIEGQDIGDVSVLQQLGLECGLDEENLRKSLAGEACGGERSIPAPESWQVSGVPQFIFNGSDTMSGAYPADTLLAAMLRSLVPASVTVTASGLEACSS